ncbi:MAG: hypothetical protein B9J98_00585 [Candidatus Terraquivivens tikiterensis]|uniref:ACT domain-containing protein n=1 Tax=Candidatus Terraquivivens tikiterensis TaxID=1980982 RepID=A0A2R7YA34_9ARCH|nr:MAG: hypothetical protein B9J98_00585 [Candidatus Terraquivivens tikiterensis]
MARHVFTTLVEDSLEAIIKVLLTTRQAQARLISAEVSDPGIENVKLLTMSVSIKPEKAEWLKRKLSNLPTVLEANYIEVGTGLKERTIM